MALIFPLVHKIEKSQTRVLVAPPVALDPIDTSGVLFFLLEDGFKFLLEDNNFLVLE